jgi:hypothetical protein
MSYSTGCLPHSQTGDDFSLRSTAPSSPAGYRRCTGCRRHSDWAACYRRCRFPPVTCSMFTPTALRRLRLAGWAIHCPCWFCDSSAVPGIPLRPPDNEDSHLLNTCTGRRTIHVEIGLFDRAAARRGEFRTRRVFRTTRRWACHLLRALVNLWHWGGLGRELHNVAGRISRTIEYRVGSQHESTDLYLKC